MKNIFRKGNSKNISRHCRIFFTSLTTGERIVTTLLPYGPEKPRAGIVKTVLTDAVEISWEPPKGGFTKYVLGVDPQVEFFNIDINTVIN